MTSIEANGVFERMDAQDKLQDERHGENSKKFDKVEVSVKELGTKVDRVVENVTTRFARMDGSVTTIKALGWVITLMIAIFGGMITFWHFTSPLRKLNLNHPTSWIDQ